MPSNQQKLIYIFKIDRLLTIVLNLPLIYNAQKLYNTRQGVMMETRRSDQGDDHISNIPPEVLLTIGTLSGASGFCNLVKTSTTMSSLRFFKEYKQTLELLRKLLSHGALGELEAAEEIWRKHPELLTCRGTISHLNRCCLDAQGQPLRLLLIFHLSKIQKKLKNYCERFLIRLLLMIPLDGMSKPNHLK